MFTLEFFHLISLKHTIYNQHYVPNIGTKLVIKDNIYIVESVFINYNDMFVKIDMVKSSKS